MERLPLWLGCRAAPYLRQAVKLLNLLSWNESSCEILVYGGTRSALPVNQSWYKVRFIPQKSMLFVVLTIPVVLLLNP